MDEAEAADDDEEEEDFEDERLKEADEVLDKDVEAAIAAVERRHETNREFMKKGADEIAEEYKRRHQEEAKMKQKFDNREILPGSARDVSVAQQSLLPSVRDPQIFKIKCKTGFELQLVRSIMLKSIDMKKNGGIIKIKSVFCNSTKGVVYVEALSEAFVKETIQGLRLLYITSVAPIPVLEMTSVLNAPVKKKPLRIGQWVRIKQGVLKGDLARVVNIFEGGARAFIQAVPRPDYADVNAVINGGDLSAIRNKKSASGGESSLRPVARLFDPAEVLKEIPNAYVARNSHPSDPTRQQYDIWNNQHFRNGFLYKDVSTATFLDTVDVRPKLEELLLFRGTKKSKGAQRDEDLYDDGDDVEETVDDDDATESGRAVNSNVNFVKELAEQIKSMGEEEEKDQVSPFVPGDMVMVIGGEMQNLVARVVSVDDATHVAKIRAVNQHLLSGIDTIDIEVDLLVKYIETGCHVKVITGNNVGQTGRVVSVNKVDGNYVAVIITDGVNSEIVVNVGHIQVRIY